MSFPFKLKLILGLVMLFIATVIRYYAYYYRGGLTLNDDWYVGTLGQDALFSMFLFAFWMIFGPSDQPIEQAETIEYTRVESSSETSTGASGDDDVDGGADGGD